jgi:low temperature requirement protein LtrA
VAGFLRAALVFGLIWWAWGGYAWMTNAIDIESTGVRLLFLLATAASFFMALAVPHAYGSQGAWFVVPYVVVRMLQLALYIWGLRADHDHQAAIIKLAPWFFVAPLVALAGGLVDDPLRSWLWAVSLAIDVGGALAVGTAGFRISPAHFAERYALFVIIALGESIVAIGVAVEELDRDLTFAVAVAIAFAGAATLWWSYFDYAALAAERGLHRAPPHLRGPFARDVFSIFHYPIVLGITFFAVAANKTLAHPSEPLSAAGRAALGLGVALYLLGFVLARYRSIRRVAWERLLGAVGALVAVVVLRDLHALWLLALVVAVLAAATAVESARLQEIRARLRAETG